MNGEIANTGVYKESKKLLGILQQTERLQTLVFIREAKHRLVIGQNDETTERWQMGQPSKVLTKVVDWTKVDITGE